MSDAPSRPSGVLERVRGDRRRLLAVLAAGLVPWVVVPYPGGASLVFSFGLVNPDPFHVVSVYDYLFVYTRELPRRLLAWPTATLLYALALGSVALGIAGFEDRRVTAGLFALAGLDVLYFATSFSGARTGTTAFPLGVAVLWLAAWTSRPGARL